MDNFESSLHILGLESTATQTEIKKAYRKLAKKWHPDRYIDRPQLLTEAQRKFQEINRAYEMLKDYTPREKISNLNRSNSSEINKQKTPPEVHYQRGVEFAEAEDYQSAIAEFSQAIKLDNRYLKAYQYRGFILSKLGYELRANADFSQVDRLQVSYRSANDTVRYRSNYRQNHSKSKYKKSQYFPQQSFLFRSQFWLFFVLILIAFLLTILL